MPSVRLKCSTTRKPDRLCSPGLQTPHGGSPTVSEPSWIMCGLMPALRIFPNRLIPPTSLKSAWQKPFKPAFCRPARQRTWSAISVSKPTASNCNWSSSTSSRTHQRPLKVAIRMYPFVLRKTPAVCCSLSRIRPNALRMKIP